MSEFLVFSLVGGLGLSVISGPLGSIILWQRMAFFGETLAHATLLGVALGVTLGLAAQTGILLVSLVLAFILVLAQHHRSLAMDTWLAIVAHGGLALGLVVLYVVQDRPFDMITSYLFGDILALQITDLLWIGCGGGLVLSGLIFLWKPLLLVTLNPDLAAAEGISLFKVRFLFMTIVALTVTITIKIVGALLLTALLVIPASTARFLAKTPEQMAVGASILCSIAVVIGIYGSLKLDLPTAPAIVVAALGLFVLTWFWTHMWRAKPLLKRMNYR